MQTQSNAHVDPLFQMILERAQMRQRTGYQHPVVEVVDEDCICPECNGSGEGMSEGSMCITCRGRGDCRGQE